MTVSAPASLLALQGAVRPISLANEQGLAVVSPLEPIIPGGALRRGSDVSVRGSAATSLAIALSVEASRSGSWIAAVGLSGLGLRASAELGVDLDRLAVIAAPPPASWPTVTASLVEAFDVVLVGEPARVNAADARRLRARLRDRGAVLIRVGWSARRWPERAELDLHAGVSTWFGIGDGHGHLHGRRVELEVSGRRGAGRCRRAEVLLPDASGGVAVVSDSPRVHADEPSRHPLELVKSA